MPTLFGSGVVGADPAIIASAGAIVRVASGVLVASPATIVAPGRVWHVGSGALMPEPPVLVASMYSGKVLGAGALQAGESFLQGAAGIPNTGTLLSGRATLSGSGAHISIIPGTGALVARPAVMAKVFTAAIAAGAATLSAAGSRGGIGTGSLFPDRAIITCAGTVFPAFAPDIEFAVELGGAFVDPKLTIEFPVVLGGSVGNAFFLSGNIQPTMVLSGSLRTGESSQSSLEAAYENTGIRPNFPITVYQLAARYVAETTEVPLDRSFIVSASYVGISGDPFFESGAFPNAIGTKVKVNAGASYLVFRAPREGEVVWFVPEERLLRWKLNRETGQYGWTDYDSMPQRGLEGQYVWSIFDPDNAHDYIAKLMGAAGWRWSYDADVLRDQIDADKCASFYLPVLAAQYGLDLDADEEIKSKRKLTANAVPSFKTKGLDRAIQLRLQSLGYRGYAREIWINPTNVANAPYYALAPLNAAGESSAGPAGNLPGAGLDYIEYPHGFLADWPDDYVLSSRLSIHVNEADGTPLDFDSGGAALKDRIYRALVNDVLPVHVDVRVFATDHPVDIESVEVAETFVITDLP